MQYRDHSGFATRNSGSAQDRLVLQDGRTLDGEIVRENDKTVSIEVWTLGSSFTQQISKSKIQSWYRGFRKTARPTSPFRSSVASAKT